MKYFPCPTGPACGPVELTAQIFSQTYRVNTGVLSSEYNVCNHQIMFSIDAGINDNIVIRFHDAPPGTVVNFGVGDSYQTAKGEVIGTVAGKDLVIGFPNRVFLSIEHKTINRGNFEFEFWYRDNEVDLYT